MDAISSFFESIKERFKNPFIFSFFVAWIFHNWQITLGLFWLDPPPGQLAHEYLFKFISPKLTVHDCLWVPLGWAFGYTFVLPLFKLFISGFSTLMGKWSDAWDIKILKGGKVKMEKYLSVKADFDLKVSQLDTVLNSENKSLKEFQDEQDKHTQTRIQLIEVQKILSERTETIKSLYDVNVMDGIWTFQSIDKITNTKKKEYLDIKKGDASTLMQSDDIPARLKYRIVNFHHNIEINRVCFDFLETRSEEVQMGTVQHGQSNLLVWKLRVSLDMEFVDSEYIKGTGYDPVSHYDVSFERGEI